MATLQRVLAATNLTSDIYYTTGNDLYSNDFDSKKPWSDIIEVTDSRDNVWIKIPKFYTKYVMDETNTYIKERYVSEFNGGNGWHLNPLFKNKNGKEIDYVFISKYLITEASGWAYSKSGFAPYGDVSSTTARALIDSWDNVDTEYEYSSFDIWALIALQDLCIIEFANSNLHSVMHGITYKNYVSKKSISGTTNSIGKSNSSAINTYKGNDSGLYAMKYRGIENVWGNGRLFVDGIYIENKKAYVCEDTSSYGKYGEYKEANLNINNTTGFVHQLGFDPETYLVYPTTTVASDGSYGDYCNTPTDNARVLCYLGAESQNGGQIGLSSFILSSVNGSLPHTVFRMIKKSK